MTQGNQQFGLSSLKLTTLVERRLFQSRMPTFLILVLAVTLIKAGVSSSSNIDLILTIARNPFTDPFRADKGAEYLLCTWLNPFLAWLLGISTVTGFVALNLLYLLVFGALFVRHCVRTLSPGQARVAILLLAFLPLPGNLLLVSNFDSLTVLLMIGILLSHRTWITLTLAVLLGFQHFEQGAAAFGALLVAVMLDRLLTQRCDAVMTKAALGLAGTILGKLGLVMLFQYYDMAPEAGRAAWAEQNLHRLVGQFVLNPQYIIYSVMGVGWLAAARFAESGRISIPFFAGLIGLMTLLPFVADQTRVLAVVTLPLIFVYWLSNEAFLASLSDRLVSEMALLWLIVPWVWVWDGKPQLSSFSQDAIKVLLAVYHLFVAS